MLSSFRVLLFLIALILFSQQSACSHLFPASHRCRTSLSANNCQSSNSHPSSTSQSSTNTLFAKFNPNYPLTSNRYQSLRYLSINRHLPPNNCLGFINAINQHLLKLPKLAPTENNPLYFQTKSSSISLALLKGRTITGKEQMNKLYVRSRNAQLAVFRKRQIDDLYMQSLYRIENTLNDFITMFLDKDDIIVAMLARDSDNLLDPLPTQAIDRNALEEWLKDTYGNTQRAIVLVNYFQET